MAVTSLTIITAQNPQGVKHTSARNYDLNRRLWLDLNGMKYDLVPIQGNYAGHVENSFLVLDMPRRTAIDLQEKYQQEAIIWGFVRNTGFERPVIHWQFIRNGTAIGHKLQQVSDDLIENREHLLQGAKTGHWELPIFEIGSSTNHAEPTPEQLDD